MRVYPTGALVSVYKDHVVGLYRHTGSRSYTLMMISVFWRAVEERPVMEDDLRVRFGLLPEAEGMSVVMSLDF